MVALLGVFAVALSSCSSSINAPAAIVLVNTDPFNGQDTFTVTRPIVVSFERAADPVERDWLAFLVVRDGALVPGTVLTTTSSVTFVPDLPLSGLTEYVCLISTTAIVNRGRLERQFHVWSFTTSDSL